MKDRKELRGKPQDFSGIRRRRLPGGRLRARFGSGRPDVAFRVVLGFALALGSVTEVQAILSPDISYFPLLSLLATAFFASVIGFIPGVVAAVIWKEPHRLHYLLGLACGWLYVLIGYAIIA